MRVIIGLYPSDAIILVVVSSVSSQSSHVNSASSFCNLSRSLSTAFSLRGREGVERDELLALVNSGRDEPGAVPAPAEGSGVTSGWATCVAFDRAVRGRV